MTEIETLKQEIKLLESRLNFLQSIQDHKEQEVKEAFKKTFGHTPEVNSDSFTYYKLGYNASKEQQNQMNEFLDNPTTIPEPKVSIFRQKLFDSIKSVFYDPEYEKTHWKLKVDMAVDEVLTQFYDILPEPEEYIGDYGPSQSYVDGFNHYYELIKETLDD
jgi:hypothetical protein